MIPISTVVLSSHYKLSMAAPSARRVNAVPPWETGVPLPGPALLAPEQSRGAPKTRLLPAGASAFGTGSQQHPTYCGFDTCPRTEEHKGVFLCPVLHTGWTKSRVWLVPRVETIVTHPSSARMTHGTLHSAS